MKNIFLYIVIFLISLITIELGSSAVLWVYRNNFANKNEDLVPEIVATNTSVPQTDVSLKARFSNPEIEGDHNRHGDEGRYTYSSYLAYGLKPIQTKFVNVSENKYRLNGSVSEVAQANDKGLTIWVFGASALFGIQNLADDETVPAYIESILRKKTEVAVNVFNFGVPGYKSFQDVQNFKMRLLSGNPDIVIFFNGFNDYVAQDDNKITQSQMVHDPFSYYWGFHKREQFINWPAVGDFFRTQMTNTAELTLKAIKFGNLVAVRGNIDIWKDQYRQRRQEELERQQRFIPLANDFLITHLRSASLLATDKKIQTILIHQPTALILDEAKVLPYEKLIIKQRKQIWSALSDDQLLSLKTVPTVRLSQDRVLDWNLWTSGYKKQIASVRALSQEIGVSYVDTQSVMETNSGKPLFVDLVHFTWQASNLIAQEISKEIIRLNPAVFPANKIQN